MNLLQDRLGREKLHIPPRLEVIRKPIHSMRVAIRPFDLECSSHFFRAVEQSRESLSPWLPWVPFNDSVDASRRYALACIKDWDAGAALRFFLRPRHQPDFIGVISLENISRLHRSCDLGYWLHPSWTGRGLMSESVEATILFAFNTLKIHRIRAAAALENSASRRVIERLGFKEEGTSREAERIFGRWVSHAVYGRLASDPPPQLPSFRR